MADIVLCRIRAMGLVVERLGPYLLIELLLPGGTLLAMLFYLYRRGRDGGAGLRRASPFAVAAGRLLAISRALVDRLPLRSADAAGTTHHERDGLEPLALAPF